MSDSNRFDPVFDILDKQYKKAGQGNRYYAEGDVSTTYILPGGKNIEPPSHWGEGDTVLIEVVLLEEGALFLGVGMSHFPYPEDYPTGMYSLVEVEVKRYLQSKIKDAVSVLGERSYLAVGFSTEERVDINQSPKDIARTVQRGVTNMARIMAGVWEVVGDAELSGRGGDFILGAGGRKSKETRMSTRKYMEVGEADAEKTVRSLKSRDYLPAGSAEGFGYHYFDIRGSHLGNVDQFRGVPFVVSAGLSVLETIFVIDSTEDYVDSGSPTDEHVLETALSVLSENPGMFFEEFPGYQEEGQDEFDAWAEIEQDVFVKVERAIPSEPLLTTKESAMALIADLDEAFDELDRENEVGRATSWLKNFAKFEVEDMPDGAPHKDKFVKAREMALTAWRIATGEQGSATADPQNGGPKMAKPYIVLAKRELNKVT